MVAKLRLELDDGTGDGLKALAQHLLDVGIAAKDAEPMAKALRAQLSADVASGYAAKAREMIDATKGISRAASTLTDQQRALNEELNGRQTILYKQQIRELADEMDGTAEAARRLRTEQEALAKRSLIAGGKSETDISKMSGGELQAIGAELKQAQASARGIAVGIREASEEGGKLSGIVRSINATNIARGHEMQLRSIAGALEGAFGKSALAVAGVGVAAYGTFKFLDMMADHGSVSAKKIQGAFKSATDDLAWGAGKVADEMAKSFDAGPLDMFTRGLGTIESGIRGILEFKNPINEMMKSFTSAGIQADADKEFEEMKAKAARSKAAVIDEMKNGARRSAEAMGKALNDSDIAARHGAELEDIGQTTDIDRLRRNRDEISGRAKRFAAENTNTSDPVAERQKREYIELYTAANRRIAELEKEAIQQRGDEYNDYLKGREAADKKAQEVERGIVDDRIAMLRDEAERQQQQFEWLRSNHQLNADQEKKLIKEIRQARQDAFDAQKKAFEQDVADAKDENERRIRALDNSVKLEKLAAEERKKIREEETAHARREFEKRIEAQAQYEQKIAAALKQIHDAAAGSASGGSGDVSGTAGGGDTEGDVDEDGQPTESALRKKRDAARKRRADTNRAKATVGQKAWDKMPLADRTALTDKVTAAADKQAREDAEDAAAAKKVADDEAKAAEDAARAKRAAANNPAPAPVTAAGAPGAAPAMGAPSAPTGRLPSMKTDPATWKAPGGDADGGSAEGLTSGISNQSEATMQLANSAGSMGQATVNALAQSTQTLQQMQQKIDSLTQQITNLGERNRAMS